MQQQTHISGDRDSICHGADEGPHRSGGRDKSSKSLTDLEVALFALAFQHITSYCIL